MSGNQSERPDYAPAAGPVSSSVKHTDATGLRTETTTIRRGGVEMPLYVASPSDGSGWPVVLVLSEAFGLHEHIRDIARRFAHEGYLAVAPDLMVRQGDPNAFEGVDDLVRNLLVKIPDPQVMGDLDACVDWAAASGGDTSRLSATGFCWGGRWTWLYAAHRPLAAAVAWYGILDGTASGLFPRDPARFPAHPVEVAPRLAAPVLGLYGGRDDAIPLSTVDLMRRKLQEGSSDARRSEIIVYPDAGHAFFADYRSSYVPGAALDAWDRALEWIKQRI